MMTTTTNTSIRVKPRRLRARGWRAGCIGETQDLFGPVADIGVLALAARLAIRTPTEHVERTVLAGAPVLVWPAPRILRQDVEVALPVRRVGLAGRFVDQRVEL